MNTDTDTADNSADDSSSSSSSSTPPALDPLDAHRRAMLGAPWNADDDPVDQYRAAMKNVRGY